VPAQTTNIFSELIREWGRFVSSNGGSRALRRWSQIETTFARFDNLDQLLNALRDRRDLDGRDELWRTLLLVARTDKDARRVALQALWPGLSKVTRMYSRRGYDDDVAAAVLAAAIARIANYPHHRPSSPVANLVRDAQHEVHVMRGRERRQDQTRNIFFASEPEVAPSEELLTLLDDAVRSGRLSQHGARLIALHRIAGISTQQLAAAEGVAPATLRKARARAERALISASKNAA
jgi:DNA-directed RNA polymerase specialized sigma24 family protein